MVKPYLIPLSEDEIAKKLKQCKVLYYWKKLTNIKKREIIYATLYYEDDDDFIDERVEELYQIFAKYKNYGFDCHLVDDRFDFYSSTKQKISYLKKEWKRLDDDEIVAFILEAELMTEDDYIDSYLDELHDQYLNMNHSSTIWYKVMPYTLMHHDDFMRELDERISSDYGKKIVSEFLARHEVQSVKKLSKGKLESLFNELGPKF
jgi:hypothetical protein